MVGRPPIIKTFVSACCRWDNRTFRGSFKCRRRFCFDPSSVVWADWLSLVAQPERSSLAYLWNGVLSRGLHHGIRRDRRLGPPAIRTRGSCIRGSEGSVQNQPVANARLSL